MKIHPLLSARSLLVGGALLALPGARPLAPSATSARSEGRTPITSLPYQIDQCGSYVVTACLTATGGGPGLVIAADDVTVDLDGFALIGGVGSTDGIVVVGPRRNVTLRDGALRGWREDGVDTNDSIGVRLERIQVSRCGKFGIVVGAAGSASECTTTGNGRAGVTVVDGGGRLERCSSFGNSQDGFAVGAGGLVAGCDARSNTSNGFATSMDVELIDCVATENGIDGFDLGARCLVSRCTASRNAIGIDAGPDGALRDCLLVDNELVGIELAASTLVVGNRCSGGGWGIRTGATTPPARHRIEGNHVTASQTGFDVGSPGNLVVGNSASGTAVPFQIAAGNALGEIVDLTAGGTLPQGAAWANIVH